MKISTFTKHATVMVLSAVTLSFQAQAAKTMTVEQAQTHADHLLLSLKDEACLDMHSYATSLHALRRAIDNAPKGTIIPQSLTRDIHVLHGRYIDSFRHCNGT